MASNKSAFSGRKRSLRLAGEMISGFHKAAFPGSSRPIPRFNSTRSGRLKRRKTSA